MYLHTRGNPTVKILILVHTPAAGTCQIQDVFLMPVPDYTDFIKTALEAELMNRLCFEQKPGQAGSTLFLQHNRLPTRLTYINGLKLEGEEIFLPT